MTLTLSIEKLKIKKSLLRLFSFFAFFVFLVNFISVPAYAQDGGFSALSACSPEAFVTQNSGITDNNAGASSLISCFQQISIVLIIFGIIIGSILAARDSLLTFIPNTGTDAAKNFRERVYGIVIGIILISLPGAILSLFNPAATGIDFLSGLQNIRQAVLQNNTTQNQNNNTNGGQTNNPNPTNNTNTPTNPNNNTNNNNGQNNPQTDSNSLPPELDVKSSSQVTIRTGKCGFVSFSATSGNSPQAKNYSVQVCNERSKPQHYEKFDFLNAEELQNGLNGVRVKVETKKINTTIQPNKTYISQEQ